MTPSPCLVHTKVPDYERFHPLFGWLLLQPSSVPSRS
jgi:hypothetical protein